MTTTTGHSHKRTAVTGHGHKKTVVDGSFPECDLPRLGRHSCVHNMRAQHAGTACGYIVPARAAQLLTTLSSDPTRSMFHDGWKSSA